MWSSPSRAILTVVAMLAALGPGLVGCERIPSAADGSSGAKGAIRPTGVGATDRPAALSHGYNDAITWRRLSDGLEEAKATARPLLLLVHASWCRMCKALRPTFFEDRVAALSSRFVMVNVDQDEIPESRSYAPDGDYVPRIVFLDPHTGGVNVSLRNPARESRKYDYFYAPRDDLAGVMEHALATQDPPRL